MNRPPAHRTSATWMFLHPDLDAQDGAPGFQVGPAGRILLVDEPAAIRQGLLILLSTAPGERLMHPSYGCPLNQLVFEPNDDTTAGIAMHYVRQAVEYWEPRVLITRLDTSRDAESPQQLTLSLEYQIKSSLCTGELSFALNLAGD